ncbi:MULTISPECIES: hypothetical protein [Haloferax]|uniref:Uncharacterized protein n=2 Tax=Haloferax TaxID=2251 RepID=A0A6G1Z7X6_9EURY|nr:MULTISPECIES: hypothetical protein [Haloferax]KAB1184782.1 hypothetical protein Hfx1149_17105 [Haloferax sp. CBA1149]MRW82414.1 hypothetical protein [Haloferax marinisediminis]
MKRITQHLIVALTVFMMVTSAAAPLAAAQSTNNSTTTATPTETPTATPTTTPTATPTEATESEPTESESCEVSENGPKLSQSRLYAPVTTINSGQSGEIEGGFQLDPTTSCPIVVHITMSVPNGMSIMGASDTFTTGAGMTSAQFKVTPQSGIKDIRANVYSENTGKRTVTADITYWPEGHKDLAKEIDGIRLTFDVEEKNVAPANASADSDSGGALGFDNLSASSPLVIIGVLALLLLIAIVGLIARGGDINVAQKNK